MHEHDLDSDSATSTSRESSGGELDVFAQLTQKTPSRPSPASRALLSGSAPGRSSTMPPPPPGSGTEGVVRAVAAFSNLPRSGGVSVAPLSIAASGTPAASAFGASGPVLVDDQFLLGDAAAAHNPELAIATVDAVARPR